MYDAAVKEGYTRRFSVMVYAAKRMGLGTVSKKKKTRKHDRCYPELLVLGEKVQIGVNEVPFNCIRGKLKSDEKHLY